MTDNLLLSLDAFIRAVRVNQGTPHALFLGAGASISSGVPSAEMCIWEWKRDIFLTNNRGLENQFGELSLPFVRERIQGWLDKQGSYLMLGDSSEYSYYIEHCYPVADHRRAYFAGKLRSAKPHIGYRLVCLMAEADIFQTVWTTNFDSLVSRAAANFKLTPVEVGIDSISRLSRTKCKGELLCVSLHGDYRYDRLKNTTPEVQNQEKRFLDELKKAVHNTVLIICGYSGRDDSILQVFNEAYSIDGASSLYWCGYGDKFSLPVQSLIINARAHGHTAYFVPTNGFDDLMERLSLHCLTNEYLDRARDIVSEPVNGMESKRGVFSVSNSAEYTFIKGNAYEVECPSDVFQFDLKEWPQSKVWEWLANTTQGRNIIAVPQKKVLCFGLIDEIKDTFGELISGPIDRSPISDRDTSIEDGAVISLLCKALVNSIAHKFDLCTDGRDSLWFKSASHHKEDSYACLLHEAIVLNLRKIDGRMFLVIKPTFKVFGVSGIELPDEIIKKVKQKKLGYQHNKEFNDVLKKWEALILPDNKPSVFEYPPGCGSTFRFKVQNAPIYASIGYQANVNMSKIRPDTRKYIKQKGFLLDEPQLLFSNKQANGYVKDTHPLRGIVTNRPYDYSLTNQGLVPRVSLGVVCPKAEAKLLFAYLDKGKRRLNPSEKERDYLIDYPGFDEIYSLPLEIPRPDESGWIMCPEINTGLDAKAGALDFARMITQSVDALHASCRANVVLVFIPARWQKWTKFETATEKFDLHDFVKAFCVQKGIATQFLDQSTLDDPQQCRVWWWLSLALYTKSMRTPWVLGSLSHDTAFVGLGFTVDHKAPKGKQVVLGCSHLYNAQGEGLQFRLSPIENPVIDKRSGNAFMSRDDARRVGETIRQLFYEAHLALPRRVVIHKQTPFRRDEREGLTEGLSGVESLDMIEINLDSSLRYVWAMPNFKGIFEVDAFPVRRGTVIKLDDYNALLWVHGATDAVKSGLRHYQGKRGVPGPIVIRRHSGHSELGLVASEILGLSKMDWNSAELYSKLPTTIDSSRKIARIGSLLHSYGPISYDYRLFI